MQAARLRAESQGRKAKVRRRELRERVRERGIGIGTIGMEEVDGFILFPLKECC